MNRKFIFEIDNLTDKQLEFVAREWGLTKAGIIRVLIKHEYQYLKEQPGSSIKLGK